MNKYVVFIPLIHWKREELECSISPISASKLFSDGRDTHFITEANSTSIKMLYGREFYSR